MSKKLTPLGKIKEHKKIEGTTAAYTTAVQKNPLWVALDAAPLQLYRSGILSQDSNCTIEVTHAVVMVGYGTDKGVQFLNIRNSWGPTWGEKGHFRIAASGIACGMYKWGAYYPVLA
jgi:C1A family cysteine protease